MTDDAIKNIQKYLGVAQTGYFGNTTLKNVKQFQLEHGLIADGVVGPITYAKMFKSVVETNNKIQPIFTTLVGTLNKDILLEIERKFDQYKITVNRLRLAHFLAQCSEECNNFTIFEENLHYSAKGLLKIFPKYFHTEKLAKQYAGKAIEIGNLVYANRYGNGNVESGDGYTYRGRGCIQTTFKYNYEILSNFIKEDLLVTPGLVATDFKVDSAIFYFTNNKLWPICDEGSSKITVDIITRKINGSIIDATDRYNQFVRYYHLLNRI